MDLRVSHYRQCTVVYFRSSIHEFKELFIYSHKKSKTKKETREIPHKCTVRFIRKGMAGMAIKFDKLTENVCEFSENHTPKSTHRTNRMCLCGYKSASSFN